MTRDAEIEKLKLHAAKDPKALKYLLEHVLDMTEGDPAAAKALNRDIRRIAGEAINAFRLAAAGMRDGEYAEGMRRNEEYKGARKKTYIYGAKHGSFDDYMVACEWRREPKAQFWLPRRAILQGKHGIVSQIENFISDPDSLFLGFSVPPGAGKTTLIKFLLAYIAGAYPDSANMYVSYSDGMIKMVYDSVHSILTDTGEYAHNEIFQNPKLTASAEYHTLSYRKRGDFPTIGLVSLGGSVTGRTRANKFLVVDDLVRNAEQARSPSRLDTLYDDYRNTLTTRTIGDSVKQIALGTIWSTRDMLSRMRAEHEDDPRYRFIRIPVWDENEVSNFEYDHPDNYTAAKIREIRATLDPVDFSCLYLQTPLEKEGLVFAADSLFYYNGVLPDGEPDDIIAYGDIAWGGGDSLSFPIGYKYGDAIFIPSVVFDRRDKFVTKPRVAGRILQHKVRRVRFEADNGGAEYSDDISRTLRTEHHYSCNISHKKAPSTQSKMSRIEQHAPVIRTFYFLDDTTPDGDRDRDPSLPKREYRDEDYRKFMNELTSMSFTAKNLHDDAADSLAGMVDFIMTGNNRVEIIDRRFIGF